MRYGVRCYRHTVIAVSEVTMEILLICLLAAAVAGLIIKLYLMKKSAREISEKLSEKLSGDTNTVIDISSGDRDMRNLAASLNTELVKLREERRRCAQGDAELKSAVTNISHDLRTPLTAMCGYLDILERCEKSEEVSRCLEQIKSRTDAMKTLTEELFRYSAAVETRELKLEKLCVNDVLAESLAAFYGAVSERGITPEIIIPEKKIGIIADRSALSRIFSNVLSNALKYSSKDLFVELSENPDNTCKVTFANSAANIDHISVERLFDRFYTVEDGNTSTGLGLSIAKLLAELCGGKIFAEIREEKLFIILDGLNVVQN